MIFELKLTRIFGSKDSSLSALWLNNKQPECFIIEDEQRDVKVQGETGIDTGRFEMKKRKVLSPMTLKYRDIYSFFDFHLQIVGLPRHKYVYIHSGNTDDDTDACLLTNYNAYMQEGKVSEYVGGRSRDAYEVVYKKISEMLNQGRVFITIINEPKVWE